MADDFNPWKYVFVVSIIMAVTLFVLFLMTTAPYHQSYLEDNDVRAPVDVYFYFGVGASIVSGAFTLIGRSY